MARCGGALWAFFARGGITFKKRLHASEQDRPDIARRRERWQTCQGRLDTRRLVFIDETWAKTTMTRRHGRCARGTRLVAHPPGRPPAWSPRMPQARWRTPTFPAGLRCDRITAPCVLDGPITGTSFRAYVEQFLMPAPGRGDVVITDNPGSHKGQAVRRPIRPAGARLSSCPAIRPISTRSSRSSPTQDPAAQRPPRTTDNTRRQIGSLLDCFTAEECANYLANAGYASS